MKKFIFLVILACTLGGAWFVHSEIYSAEAQPGVQEVTFSINDGESLVQVADRLEQEQVVRSSWLFRKYLQYQGLDTNIRTGDFLVKAPITLARVVESLDRPSISEREITLIPGWTLHDMATYFVAEGLVSSEEEFYALTGNPAERGTTVGLTFEQPPLIIQEKPTGVSLEGYFRPDTFRFFTTDSIEDILRRLVLERQNQLTDQMLADIDESGRTIHQILTMASFLESEVRSSEDRAMVSDLFWRRFEMNWALQADSSVHYIFGKNGSVFTTKEMRDSLNPYNTYKYPGLPPGPISTPSKDAIMAAIYPQDNEYWYFLTTLDTGEVKYAETLEQHNRNAAQYLR